MRNVTSRGRFKALERAMAKLPQPNRWAEAEAFAATLLERDGDSWDPEVLEAELVEKFGADGRGAWLRPVLSPQDFSTEVDTHE